MFSQRVCQKKDACKCAVFVFAACMPKKMIHTRSLFSFLQRVCQKSEAYKSAVFVFAARMPIKKDACNSAVFVFAAHLPKNKRGGVLFLATCEPPPTAVNLQDLLRSQPAQRMGVRVASPQMGVLPDRV